MPLELLALTREICTAYCLLEQARLKVGPGWGAGTDQGGARVGGGVGPICNRASQVPGMITGMITGVAHSIISATLSYNPHLLQVVCMVHVLMCSLRMGPGQHIVLCVPPQ